MDTKTNFWVSTIRSATETEAEFTERIKTIKYLIQATKTLPSKLAEKIDQINSEEMDEAKMTLLTSLLELKATLKRLTDLKEEVRNWNGILENKISSGLEEVEESRESVQTEITSLEERIRNTDSNRINRLMGMQINLQKLTEISNNIKESDSLKDLLNKIIQEESSLEAEIELDADELKVEINKLKAEIEEEIKKEDILSFDDLKKEIKEIEEQLTTETRQKRRLEKENTLVSLKQIMDKYENLAEFEWKLKNLKIGEYNNKLQLILKQLECESEAELLKYYDELKLRPKRNQDKITKCEAFIKIKELIKNDEKNQQPNPMEPDIENSNDIADSKDIADSVFIEMNSQLEIALNDSKNNEQIEMPIEISNIYPIVLNPPNNAKDVEQVIENLVIDSADKTPIGTIPPSETEENFDMSKKLTIIKELFCDTEEMPNSVERNCKRITMLTLIHSLEKNYLKQIEEMINYLKDPNYELGQEIKSLKTNMMREDLYNSSSNIFLVEKIEICFSNNDYKSVADSTKMILTMMISLDVKFIKRLVDMNKSAECLLLNADCVIFLGGSGAGKSTSILYLSGCKMEKIKYKGILDHISPVEITNPMLKKVTTNPEGRSETKFIIPVKLTYAEVGYLIKDGEFILVDMPGFGDTDLGPEGDIANAYGVINSLAKANSIRLVFPFSYMSLGDKFEGLTRTAHYIVNMIKGDNKGDASYFKSFTYLFTKFPENSDAKQVYNMINNKREHLNQTDKEDSSFNLLFADMLRKTRNNRALLVNPLKEDERENIWNEILDTDPIKYPGEVLAFCMTEETRIIINEHLKKRRMSIVSACKHKNFPLIKYIFEEILYLYEITKSEFINRELEECKFLVKECLQKNYSEGIERLNRCLSLNNELTEGDVKEYIERIENAQLADALKATFYDNSVISSEAFVQNVHTQILNTIKSLEDFKMRDISYQLILDKIMFLSNKFESVKPIYLNLKSKIETQIENTVLELIKEAKERKFDECNTKLQEYFIVEKMLDIHLDKACLQNINIRIKDELFNILNKLIEKSHQALKKQTLDENGVEFLNENLMILEKIDSLPYVKLYFESSDYKVNQEALLEKVAEYFNKVNSQIIEKINKKEENSLKTIEPLFEQLQLIKRIPLTSKYTSEKYFETTQLIFDFINNIRRDLEMLALNLFKFLDMRNIDRLHSNMVILKEAKWVDQLREDSVTNIVDKLENEIKEQLTSYMSFIVNSQLNLEDFEGLKDLTEKVCFVVNMKVFGKKYEKEIQMVIEWYESTVKCIYSIIENFCKEDKFEFFDYAKFEKMHNFLNEASKIFFIGLPTILNKNVVTEKIGLLDKLINKYSRFVFGTIENSMTKIIDLKNMNNDVASDINNLVDQLNELKRIQTRFPIILSLIDHDESKITKIFRNIQKFYNDLKDHLSLMYNANSVVAFNKALNLSKSLIGVDEYLNSNLNFRELYQTFSECDRKNMPQNLGEMIKLISECRFSEITNRMSDLNLIKVTDPGYNYQFEQLQLNVLSKADELIEMNRLLARKTRTQLNIEEFDKICKNFSHLSSIKQYLSSFLDKSLMNSKIEAMSKIKKTINENILENLNRIIGIISNCNLFEADKFLNEIKLVCSTLGVEHCEENIWPQIEEVNKMRKIKITDLLNRYEELSISEYTTHPPKEILLKLSQDTINNPYSETIAKIKDIIVGKYRIELKRIKSEMRSKFQIAKEIRRLETSLQTLPDNMQIQLAEEIRSAKEDIEYDLEHEVNELDAVIKKKDYNRLNEMIQKYKRERSVDLQRQIEAFVIKEAGYFKSEIETSLTEGKVHTSMKTLQEFFLLSKNFEGEIKQIIDDTKSKLENYFKTLCDVQVHLFKNDSEMNQANFLNVEDSFESEANLSHFEIDSPNNKATQAYEVIKEFFKFKKENCDVMSCFAPVFDKFVSKAFSKIGNCLNEAEDKVSSFLKGSVPDILSIKTILNTKKLCYNYMQKFNSDVDIFEQEHSDLVKAIRNTTFYRELTLKVSDKLNEFKENFIKRPLINQSTTGLDKHKHEFYEQQNKEISAIKKVKVLRPHIRQEDLDTIETECLENIKSKVLGVIKDSEKILEESKLNKENCEKLSVLYVNLHFIRTYMPVDILGDVNPHERLENIKDKLITRVTDISEDLVKRNNVNDVAQGLIDMKTISEAVPYFKSKIDEQIDDVLLKLKKKSNLLGRISSILEQDIIGKDIVYQHKSFEDARNSLFIKKTSSHDIEYVLENIRGDNIDKDKLRKKYIDCMKTYKHLVEVYLKKDIDFGTLTAELKNKVGNVVQKKDNISYGSFVRNKIPEIVGFIFAIWTLQNSGGFFEVEGGNDRETFLKQPLAAQVVSILRILGIGDTQEHLQNNLVQIGTGEGKSLTLAVVSSVLALLGFDISCVCYSSILSTRDFNAFNSLFDILGVSQYIYYGTFKGICERMLNKTCNIREKVTEIILGNNSSSSNASASANSDNNDRAKILVVDEVDTFLCQDFYGNEYLPSASLRHPLISSFIKSVWQSKDKNSSFEELKELQEFKDLHALFKDYGFLIEEALKQMLRDIKTLDTHTYFVIEDKIGYKDQDEIVFNISYGYKTVFDYLKAFDENKITEKSMEENLCISLRCGCFSYAKIPLQVSYIFGVTGTLETISEPEKQILQNEYRVLRNTYMPSVFGKNERKFNKFNDLRIEKMEDYFNTINTEIKSRMTGNIEGTYRSVLVGFEDIKDLNEFYNSKEFSYNKDKAKLLTEEASSLEKYPIIQNATCQGQITLFTRAFGRGIDYIIRDPIVIAQGGVHVIQTFLSEELSEEVQIKGRVARQGDPGSYSMILLESNLEAYGILPEDVEKNKAGLYDYINSKRNKFFNDKYESNKKNNKSLIDFHQKSQNFLNALNIKDHELIKQFLFSLNKSVIAGNVTCKTIILVDATISMGGLLMRCICTIGDMFERILVILKNNNIDPECFEIKIVAYRNYNSKQEDIWLLSSWEAKPENLKAFMKGVKNSGGWGNEAIEVGLWHANEEMQKNKFSQVIIIGDAPANTPEEVTYKRQKGFGEDYWKNTKFSTPTTYIEEMNKLIAQNIPIHAFYLHERAKENFTEMATKSGGRCEFLDIESDKGTDILTAFITEEILRVIGSNSGVGNNLVSEYQTRYAKTYK